ncbi:MAG: GAF domain-containing protein [Chroococcidiopsidaceae cyanobacterium CP_BM_ER_R8_30]|nr:GAF domain-containing protein [Chroococcidiopsidaceae cyanobacterium CP_BM_ER_R8_30]
MTTRFDPNSQIYKQRQYEEDQINDNRQYSHYPIGEHKNSFWQRLGLRTKAITIAVTLSTIPILVIGTTAYYLTNKKLTDSVTTGQQAQALGLATEISRFTLERYKDTQTIAQLGIFDNPNIRASTSDQEKQAILDQYLGKGYDNIAITDLTGRTIYQATGRTNANLGPQDYFQQAIRSNRPVMTSSIETGSGYAIFVAAPIVDTVTHRTIGAVQSHISLSYLNQLLQTKVKNSAEAFAASRWLIWVLAVGTVLEALLVGVIAAYLVSRGLRPLRKATNAVQKLGQGQLDTRLAIEGEDELAVLGSNINQMANQLQTLLEKQDAETELAKLFADITLRVRQSLNLGDILKTAVREARTVLQADRVVIYQFKPDWSGVVVAESVLPGWTQTLGEDIDDLCFKDYVSNYKNGRVRAIDNIYKEGLTECYLRLLERFQVKANLVAPIQIEGRLLGLLIAHQCSAPRAWQRAEIDLFAQFAMQVGFAIDQANLLKQVEQARASAEATSSEQRQQKENLQRQLMALLGDIEGAAKGDLTVRAEVTAGEIGTVGDFFNAIVESLRQLVTQVKTAAAQVNASVGQNEGAIRQLADQAVKQAEEITHTLDSVEQMTLSIQAVAESARQAAEVARTASDTATNGEMAMDRTVQSILNLRETVAETANKVKRLGESSQQISKVVFLINQIALQTNVLAINASIEAARAGDEGRGFAVVAEEVGGLAAQSAAATKEIEQIVENIQQETSEVVKAMELGTTQVIEGTHLVKDTKQSLGQILEVSHRIDQLVQLISNATVSQAQTSQSVTHLMKEIAKVSEHTSDASRQVAGSLQETVEVAKQLQASVGAFKVGAES